MEKFKSFINELLLYSGQYALFYIIMNFSKDGLKYFNDTGHTILLFVLIFQTLFLIIYGKKAIFRFIGSLIAPLFYTLIEYRIDYDFVFNTAHLFFWFFSILVGGIQALQIKTKKVKIKKVNEYIITFLNIIIFLFIYFYFDLSLGLKEQVLRQEIDMNIYAEKLSVFHLLENISIFLKDPAHIFILIGGLILSFSIAVGRVKILELNDEIKRLFGRYIDNNVRDQIISDGLGKSEEIDLCILFSDIRNFTQISEKYKAEEITAMLNLYFTQWSDLSEEYNGIIDKYIGDAVMIVFRDDKNISSTNGVNCAIKMMKKLDQIKLELSQKGLPIIENIGIGLHYGTVIAGDIGSKNRVNYTYIGDSVNIASRLEGLCKQLKSNIVISEAIYENINSELQNHFKKNHTDIILKGKQKLVNVYYYK